MMLTTAALPGGGGGGAGLGVGVGVGVGVGGTRKLPTFPVWNAYMTRCATCSGDACSSDTTITITSRPRPIQCAAANRQPFGPLRVLALLRARFGGDVDGISSSPGKRRT